MLSVIFGLLLALAAYAGEGRFTDLVLSDAQDGPAKQVFKPDTPKLFLRAKLAGLPKGAKLKSAWIAEKTKVAPPNYEIDSAVHPPGSFTNRATFTMTKPNKGWPPGDYRVDLLINDKVVNSVKFQIAP